MGSVTNMFENPLMHINELINIHVLLIISCHSNYIFSNDNTAGSRDIIIAHDMYINIYKV